MVSAMNLFVLQHAGTEEDAKDIYEWANNVLCGFVMALCGTGLPWVSMSLGLANYKHMEGKWQDVPVSVDHVYKLLEEYRRSRPDGDFFCMNKDEFLEELDTSLGPYKSLTPMSLEFAALAFDSFKDAQMTMLLRSNDDAVAKDLSNLDDPSKARNV